MTLGALGLLALFVAPLFLGLGLLRLIGWKWSADPLAGSSMAYLAGCLGLGVLLTAWLACALPLEGRTLLPALLVVGALCFGAPRRRHAVLERASRAREWPRWAALGVVLALSLARVLDAARLPVLAGDEAGIYAHKAKILFDVGRLGPPLADRARQQAAFHFDYPSLDPLLQLYSFVLAGKILLVENRFLVQLSALALLALLASALRARLRPAAAAVLLLVAATAPVLRIGARNGGADAMTALGLLAALEFGLRWLRTRRAEDLGAGSFALAFLVWSKNEGLLYALVVVAALAASAVPRPRARDAAALLLRPRALAERELRVTAAVVGALLVGLFVVYLLTPNDLAWHLETSAMRVVGHALQATVLGLAQLVERHPWLGPRLALHQPEVA